MSTPHENLEIENRLLVKVEEAGRMLGFSRAKSYNMATSGEMPGVIRLGRSVRVSVEALREYVRKEVKSAERTAA